MPLAEACAALHVFDRPTEWGGALWLPYRRQRAELEAAIRAATSPVKAVFGHADVVSNRPFPDMLAMLCSLPLSRL